MDIKSILLLNHKKKSITTLKWKTLKKIWDYDIKISRLQFQCYDNKLNTILKGHWSCACLVTEFSSKWLRDPHQLCLHKKWKKRKYSMMPCLVLWTILWLAQNCLSYLKLQIGWRRYQLINNFPTSPQPALGQSGDSWP